VGVAQLRHVQIQRFGGFQGITAQTQVGGPLGRARAMRNSWGGGEMTGASAIVFTFICAHFPNI
jgi:hypothetical protein